MDNTANRLKSGLGQGVKTTSGITPKTVDAKSALKPPQVGIPGKGVLKPMDSSSTTSTPPKPSMLGKRLMSDAEIRRRKRFQSDSSKITGGLGLAALGGTLLATKRGQAGIGRAFKAVGKPHPEKLKTAHIKSKVEPVLATSAGVGGVSAFNFAAYTNAEAKKRKQPVVKTQAADYHWTHHFNSPRALKTTAKSNPQLAAFGAGTALALAPQTRQVQRHLSEKGKKNADKLAAGAIGASTGQAAYQGVAYGTKHARNKIYDKKIYEPAKPGEAGRKRYREKYKAAGKEHEKLRSKHGLRNPNVPSDHVGYWRNYPKSLPGHTPIRVLGHTHGGKTGVLVGAAATAAGALGGVKVEEKLKERKKVSKNILMDEPVREGLAKNYDEAVQKAYTPYDPERKRAKRAENYEIGAKATAVGAGVGVGYQGARALQDRFPKKTPARHPKGSPGGMGGKFAPKAQSIPLHRLAHQVGSRPLPGYGKLHALRRPAVSGTKLTHSGKALGLTALAAGALGVAQTIRHKRSDNGSWTQWDSWD